MFNDIVFWIVAVSGSIIRLLLSPWIGWLPSIISFVTAIFFAIVFTDSVVDFFNLNPEVYRLGVTAIVALTGESIARWVMKVLNDPNIALEWFKAWRGGGRDRDKK